MLEHVHLGSYVKETVPTPWASERRPIGRAVRERSHLPLLSRGKTPASIVVRRIVPLIPA
jgi:hypothetical protein